ncbi:MAG TPA: serine/threonine-protein kinase [Planctomycetaceae bacterium]|jgi:serine/threonine protein kinase|nr:serine/threonine-protein kinase [Planctomycetaceae bacterium]
MDESGQLDPSVDPRLEEVLSEYSRRVAAGESISPSDLISANPAVAEALRSYFAVTRPGNGEAADHDTDLHAGTQYVRLESQATIPPKKPTVAAALPERFGRYRIVRSLGRGAMGDVYLAEDTQLDRSVALKIPRFADDDGELFERFYREARAAATLRHPNLCPVHDAGEIDGIHYLSMAFIEGRPLYDVLAEKGRPPEREAATIILKLAKALDAAHRSGVIHRDLKPANIMIDGQQEPIIMDFGLARRTNKEDARLTQSGLVMGSPTYMSPEQVEGDGDKIGPASDIYSLGVVFYELLSGEVPFRGSIASVLGQIVTVAPKKPSTIVRSVDPALEAICLKMLAKRPEDRFGSMRDVANALDAYLAGRPTGVVASPREQTAETRPLETERSAGRGITIAPWMLVTALVLIIGGFGITWRLIAVMLKQQVASGEIALSQSTREALSHGDAHVLINGKELTQEQLQKPIVLPAGSNNFQVESKNETTPAQTIPSGTEDPTLLEHGSDGKWVFKPLQQHVAESVLARGGKLKLVGSDAILAQAADLPTSGSLHIEEINLAGAKAFPGEDVELIKKLTKTLKRLQLPKSGFSDRQFNELREALKDCKVERATESS